MSSENELIFVTVTEDQYPHCITFGEFYSQVVEGLTDRLEFLSENAEPAVGYHAAVYNATLGAVNDVWRTLPTPAWNSTSKSISIRVHGADTFDWDGPDISKDQWVNHLILKLEARMR